MEKQIVIQRHTGPGFVARPVLFMQIIDPFALDRMRELGGSWWAYQNHDLGHPEMGHLKFLKCGAGCTYLEPPQRMPDTETDINWRYVLVGRVDVEKGTIAS